MPVKKSYREYIIECKKIHNNYYNYPKYQHIENSTSIIIIICPIHGEFKQRLSNHKSGQNCPKCSAKKRKKKDYKEHIEKCMAVYNNYYSYPKQEIKGCNSKIKVICPKHGEFNVSLKSHKEGKSGCKKCWHDNLKATHSISLDDYILEFNKRHNNYYSYPKNQDISNKRIDIICPMHGKFEQAISNHMSGQGCPDCGLIKKVDGSRKSYSTHINHCKEVHNDFYSYPDNQELPDGVFTKIKIICPSHGEFEQSLDNHKRGHGCPKCTNFVSKAENEIEEWLKSIKSDIIIKRNIYFKNENKRREADLYLPEYNLVIEHHGIFWHSDLYVNRSYHQDKYLFFRDLNINIIQIFQNEWLLKRKIVKSIILNKIGLNKKKIYARKCIVKEIDKDDYRKFCKKNHIQGYKSASYMYGLYYKDRLVQALSFTPSRHNKSYDYEIIRGATLVNTNVIGGFNKLLKYFIKLNPNKSIVTYTDLRYFTGNGYIKSGFKFLHISNPNYFYYKKNTLLLESRLKFQKHKLSNQLDNFDPNLTEYENMINNGYYRIFDCGNAVFALV